VIPRIGVAAWKPRNHPRRKLNGGDPIRSDRDLFPAQAHVPGFCT
jgi:hypothetical protein